MRQGILFSIIVSIIFCSPILAYDWSINPGDGSESKPYQISTPEQMNAIGANISLWNKHFKLMNDIDMSALAGSPYNVIGNNINQFTGFFDGNGHVISNLTISLPSTSDVGLFGLIGLNGRVSKLGLENANVTGVQFVGCLVGRLYRGNITQCYAKGRVSGFQHVGGLAGYSDGSSGVYGTLSSCYAMCDVSGEGNIGGLIGTNYHSGRTEYCYAASTVSGTSYTGGIAGVSYGSYMLIKRSFWDVEKSETLQSDGGQGVLTSQMHDMLLYSLNGWAGVEGWIIDNGNDYPRLEWEGTTGTPIVDLPIPLNGSGTETSPYEIHTTEDLQVLNLGGTLLDKHFKLMNDLDLDGVRMLPIGIGNDSKELSFAGVFDGNGQVISNVTLNYPDSVYIGFFGSLAKGSIIKNLGIQNISVTGYDVIGGVAGVNNGKITGCYSTGSLLGSDTIGLYDSQVIGGLVGFNDTSGIIENCYAKVNLTGNRYCGGLVGSDMGYINNCFSTGKINAVYNYGGLVGIQSGKNFAQNSFWDILTSEVCDSPEGRGLPSSYMKNALFYGLNGWYGNIWTIDDGQDYPHLAWENTGHPLIPEVSVLLLGSGTETDPYQIHTAMDLQFVGISSGLFWDKNFILMNNLNLNGIELLPIGYRSLGFTGAFEGNGHVISNLSLNLNNVDYVGLFGHVGRDGIIQNLGIENANIRGKDYVGGLVGYANNATIISCYATGISTGKNATGGLLGKGEYGLLKNCRADVDVESQGISAGGMIGYSKGLDILECYSNGDVLGIEEVGGLMGQNDSQRKTCLRSYATGDVTGQKTVGGFVGINRNGQISQCFSTGFVTGDEYIGGFVGVSHDNEDLINCYWDTETSGINFSDGGRGFPTKYLQSMLFYSLCGWDGSEWTINDGMDYPHLAWESTGDPFIIEMPVPLQGSGTDIDPYQITTEEDLILLGYANTIWDKSFILLNDLDFSELRMFCFIGYESTGFTGSFDGNGFSIKMLTYQSQITEPHLGLFSYANNATINNLILEDFSLSYPGERAGGLVGWQDKGMISNCHIVRGYIDKGNHYGSCGGLVGYMYQGMIKNCTSQCIIVGGGNKVGGLLGHQEGGSINHCQSSGSVAGSSDVGGLVGYQKDGTISYSSSQSIAEGSGSGIGGLVGQQEGYMDACYSSGYVSGTSNVGGLIGYLRYSRISNCYATGFVEGSDYGTGGLIGLKHYGNISKCYSTGHITGFRDTGGLIGASNYGNVVDSFWDIDTSGITKSKGGLGLSTLEMQHINTYLNAHWDLLGEDINGTDDIWFLRDEIEYPRLVALNKSPTAEAGSNQTAFAWDGWLSKTKLDGTNSYDPDGDMLEYLWFDDANDLIASGAEPNVMLPPGEHEIHLIVNDGIEDSEPNSVFITVIEAYKVPMTLTPLTLNCRSQGNSIKAHFTLSEEYSISDIDVDKSAVVYSFGIESTQLDVSANEGGSIEFTASFDREHICSLSGGWPEILRVYGYFTDGSIFFGDSKIRINPAGLKEISELASYWLEDCVRPNWCNGLDMNRDMILNFQDYSMLLSSEVEFTEK